MNETASSVIAVIFFFGPTLVVAGVILAFNIYAMDYFTSEPFLAIKQRIANYVADCNALNEHITDLRNTYASMRKTDYGEATYQNISQYKYKKSGYANYKSKPNIVEVSKTVCDGARRQPFKYVCKYFNIEPTEETLEQFEDVLNNFIAAEDGKVLSERTRTDILRSIRTEVPWIINNFFGARLAREVGFQPYSFSSVYFPTYSFRYISSGGKSGSQFDITFDIPMLERFIGYLGDVVKFKKSAAGQRRLMTPKLRAFIIDRDGHACRNCGNSTMEEPNLLLEVDHIIPIAKGGMTTEENLQCLCWKCNRSKGAKVV